MLSSIVLRSVKAFVINSSLSPYQSDHILISPRYQCSTAAPHRSIETPLNQKRQLLIKFQSNQWLGDVVHLSAVDFLSAPAASGRAAYRFWFCRPLFVAVIECRREMIRTDKVDVDHCTIALWVSQRYG